MSTFLLSCRVPTVGPSSSHCRRQWLGVGVHRFELEITNSADPYGAVPLAPIRIGGHVRSQGPHPIATGAQLF
jgi:hypothetical protein